MEKPFRTRILGRKKNSMIYKDNRSYSLIVVRVCCLLGEAGAERQIESKSEIVNCFVNLHETVHDDH